MHFDMTDGWMDGYKALVAYGLVIFILVIFNVIFKNDKIIFVGLFVMFHEISKTGSFICSRYVEG
jgi:hypothetical protein